VVGGADPTPVLFEPYGRQWVSKLIKPSRETKRKYIERLERYVFPVLGGRPAAGITRGEMRAWQAGLRKEDGSPLAPKTIANIRGETLYPMFETMCSPGDDGEPPLRSYNPLRGLDLPTGEKYLREILETREQATIFLETAYEVDAEAGDLLATKLAGGFRWGEVAAIPSRAVSTIRGTIEVRQVLVQEDHRWYVRPKPKTPDGFRQYGAKT
jgi:hypothetical protein